MTRYDMNTRPDTWPKPDDLDHILAAERYEASDDYDDDVRDWLTTSDHALEWAYDEYPTTSRYEHTFRLWMDGGAP